MGGTEGVRDPLGIGKRDDEGTGGIRQRVGAGDEQGGTRRNGSDGTREDEDERGKEIDRERVRVFALRGWRGVGGMTWP